MRIVAVGGCGDMGRYAVATALRYPFINQIVIADRDQERAAAFAAACGPKASAVSIDAEDEDALRHLFHGADVVLNTAGPFYRFGVKVLRAAIAAGCHYLDINDDWEPTLDMLELDENARRAGVIAVVGMGASPGVSNLLAARAMRQLDRVDAVYTAWSLEGARAEHEHNVAGTTQPRAPSAAIVHFLHQITGTIRVRRDGAFVDCKPIEEVRLRWPGVFDGCGWTVGHPEAVTLPRYRPEIRNSANVVLASRPVVAVLKEVAQAIDAGHLTQSDAAVMLAQPLPEPDPTTEAEPAPGPPLFALALGVRDGKATTAGALVRAAPTGGMGGATGVPLAVGLDLVARHRITRAGVFAPEAAIDPDAFFDVLAPLCTPPQTSHEDLVFVTTGG
jgi:saccharopine dehydrogenase-like NADP-dependent oxidoreductase